MFIFPVQSKLFGHGVAPSMTLDQCLVDDKRFILAAFQSMRRSLQRYSLALLCKAFLDQAKCYVIKDTGTILKIAFFSKIKSFGLDYKIFATKVPWPYL